MRQTITMEQLQEHLFFFRKMYDIVRLVDPQEKRVLEEEGSCVELPGQQCYAYWEDGGICDNCISVRAWREKKCYMKLEQSPKSIMLVTAIPLENSERPVVLELLKNATETMMIGYGDRGEDEILHDMVCDLNKMAIRDHLTGCYNRRFLDERLPADVARAVAERRPLTVLFIDIDNMKLINDSYGHVAGDLVLKHVGAVLRKNLPCSTDWVARYGGDEFFLCLNRTEAAEADTVGARISAELKRQPVLLNGKAFFVSVSFGSETLRDTPHTPEELIQMADQKMYWQKRRKKSENS